MLSAAMLVLMQELTKVRPQPDWTLWTAVTAGNISSREYSSQQAFRRLPLHQSQSVVLALTLKRPR